MAFTNPAGWPEEILGIVEKSLTVEYASLTKKGVPITFPLMPQVGENGRTLDVATGLTYPVKAERARNNPKVCLLYSEPLGCGLDKPPVVLIFGEATVCDADLQANTDRYVRFATKRFAELGVPIPAFFLRTMTWYLARIFIKVTPMRILWWEGGVLSNQPRIWQAPDGTQAPESDPPPVGKGLPRLSSPATEWHSEAEYAVKSLGKPVLTVVDADGYPVPFRAQHASNTVDGFHLELCPGTPAPAQGKASLCFHLHDEKFSWNENKTFVGEMTGDVDIAFFKVDRLLVGQSLKKGSQVRVMLNMFKLRRQLAPRLKPEALRRGQPVPKIHIPA
jgi:hypothetical protein